MSDATDPTQAGKSFRILLCFQMGISCHNVSRIEREVGYSTPNRMRKHTKMVRDVQKAIERASRQETMPQSKIISDTLAAHRDRRLIDTDKQEKEVIKAARDLGIIPSS